MLSEEDSDLRLLDLAMDGLGTDEMALIEFLCARPPARVRPTLNPNPNSNPNPYPNPNPNPYPNPNPNPKPNPTVSTGSRTT